MELPFYLRILPPEALEVLAYYRRLGNNLALADALMASTGLSDRGFGKAIRRLVTKGYLVLDGEQRYRLTEHGQRAVDDLPDSMAERGSYTEPSEVEHVPVVNTDTFENLFNEPAEFDSLFTEPVSDSVDPNSFLSEDRYEDAEAVSRLFDSDENDDDLFAELNDEDAAAFDELFGGADEPATPVSTPPASAEAASLAEADEADEEDAPAATPAPEDDLFAPISLEDLFAGLEDNDHQAEALDAPEDDEDEATPETAEAEAKPELEVVLMPALNDDLFQWLELDDDSPTNEDTGLWDDLSIEAPDAGTSSRIVGRRLMLALPQPLVAEQPAHVTVGILPDAAASLAEPMQLMLRLAVLNGEPAGATEFPMLLTNGLTRQDLTIVPGRYNQVRLRVRVYQLSDDADEAILCGGMYVDADVVEAADGQSTPIAFGADTHFVLDA